MTYLVDTSVFTRTHREPIGTALRELAAVGEVTVCGPVAFELGFSARNRATYDALFDLLGGFPWAPTTDGDHRRALDVQRELVGQGHHRAISIVDGLVAAIAESRSLAVLHYDSDFELIADVTGQAHHWIVPRGSVD